MNSSVNRGRGDDENPDINSFGEARASRNFASSNKSGLSADVVDRESLSLISERLSKLKQNDGRRGAVEAVYFGNHFFGSKQDSLAFLINI